MPDTINILLVEDNPVNVSYIEALVNNLEALDEGSLREFALSKAGLLAEAIEHVSLERVDIILLDLTLPDSSGLETFEKIHQVNEDIPVIVLTGLDDTNVALRAVKLGAQDYIIKGKLTKLLLFRSIVYAMERTAVLRALKESEDRYSLVLKATNDGIWEWNLRNRSIYFSPRWKEILGFSKEELKNTPDEWFKRIHPDEVNRVEDELALHLDGKSPSFTSEHRLLHKNGSYIWVRMNGKALSDHEGALIKIAGSLTDITAEKLEDSLTGLPNKVLFLDRLAAALKRVKYEPGSTFVYFAIGIDNYRWISNNLGGKAADELLLTVVHRLEPELKPTDTIGRIEGDILGLLAHDLDDIGDITNFMETLQSAVAKPKEISGQTLVPTISIGIVNSSTLHKSGTAIIGDGETALRVAMRREKGGREIFDKEIRDEAFKVIELEANMRKALERFEFSLVFQPIMDLSTNRIANVEALIRWYDKEKGEITPGVFIPVAEKSDLIMMIGNWVMEEVALQIQRWELAGQMKEVGVAINFSGRQFSSKSMCAYLKKTLDLAGISHQRIEIEVTESVAMQDLEHSIKILNEMNKMGFSISIDDFGTGYSSLSYLRRFPLKKLKIDQSFIKDLPGNADSIAIVSAVIYLAKALNYMVVAEGVETWEQLEFLRIHGVNYVQGYFIGQPMKAEEVAGFVETFQGFTSSGEMILQEGGQ